MEGELDLLTLKIWFAQTPTRPLFNTLSQVGEWMLEFFFAQRLCKHVRQLLRRANMLSCNGTIQNFISNKWQFISIWYVLSWKTRLDAMCIAAWVSQYIIVGPEIAISKYVNGNRNKVSSQNVPFIAQYLASALDGETGSAY